MLVRRSIAIAGIVSLFVAGIGATAPPAVASTLCVAVAEPECFSSIQAAVDAASDGDTITIAAGTFDGGITIDESVDLVGAGPEATIIDGGGPVVTIGTLFATTEPTVSIARVTITGGVTDSKPDEYWTTEGGGVWIPPAEEFTTGATVSITDSVISGNTVAPAVTDPPEPWCGPIGCAIANAGGIANAGNLTITDSRVSDNSVGPSIAHEAVAGGIRNHDMGTLTLKHTSVTGNRVIANGTNGILAVAGGISDHGVLTIEDSVVSANVVSVDASFSGEARSVSGGIELTGTASATITDTIIRNNRVEVTNADGPAFAGVGGISTSPDVSLRLRDSTVASNHVSARISMPGADVTAYAGGLEIQGHVKVTGSRFIANEVDAFVPDGVAVSAGGGLFAWAFTQATVTDSVVRRNIVRSTSSNGFAQAAGGGVLNAGDLMLLRTLVRANVASAGGFGQAQGGGVWNGVVSLPDFPGEVHLRVIGSKVTDNRLTGDGGEIGLEGAGIFTDSPITLTGSEVAGNHPDQCFGC